MKSVLFPATSLSSLCPKPIWNSEEHPDAKIDLSSETLPSSPSSETPAEQPEDKMPDSNSLALFSDDDTPSQSPLPFPYTHVSESLLKRANASLSFSPTYAHVSRPGDEIISVTMHGATSLPPLRDGGAPTERWRCPTAICYSAQWSGWYAEEPSSDPVPSSAHSQSLLGGEPLSGAAGC
ncbi:hypothetical protein SRHO_G00093730 [Serrasalmus rhombeus]